MMGNCGQKMKFAALLSAAVFAAAILLACQNPIIERWWGGGGEEDDPPVIVSPFAVVSFDAGGGIPGPLDLYISWGNVIGRMRPVLMLDRENYGFLGWFAEDGTPWDMGTRPVLPEDDLDNDGFITITAHWRHDPYRVSFVPGAASTAQIPDQLVAPGGTVVEPVTPTAADSSVFAGWHTAGGIDDIWGARWDFATDTVSAHTTLYARWVGGNIRTVILEPMGGTMPDGSPLEPTRFSIYTGDGGGRIQEPGALVMENHSFGGWFTDLSFAADSRWSFADDRVPPGTEPFQLYARWDVDDFAVVTFEAVGGIPEPRDLRISWGSTVGRLPPMQREGFGFAGWFAEDGSLWDPVSRAVSPADDVDADGFVTLTARWEVAPHNVIFRPGQGSPGTIALPPMQMIPDGGWAVEPKQPIDNEGRTFMGWWAANGIAGVWGARWDFATAVTASLTLYARWSDVMTRTVIFEPIGGTRPDGSDFTRTNFTVIVGGTVQHPGPLVRQGHAFGGWYTETSFRTQWNFATDTVPAGAYPLILYARWDVVTLPPETIVSQIRVIAVDYIDFAGNSTVYNQTAPGPGAATPLQPHQVNNNIAAVNSAVGILRSNPTFLIQLSGHANPVTQDLEAERPELEAISRARADSVAAELARQGVPQARTVNVGFNPRNFSSDPEHVNLNRCVELVIFEIVPPTK